MKTLALFLGLTLLLAGCNNTQNSPPPEPDDTGVNTRDADGSTKTPMDQSNDQPDIDIVAQIRSQILEIDDLSTQGQNVKIITDEEQVTLRGPVASEAEREAIVQVAEANAGERKVNNELEVDAE